MTDTAKPFSLKPTPELQKEIDTLNANLIPLESISAEVIAVLKQTGFTPRQLLEQRNKLINLLEEFMLSDMDHPLFDDAHKLILDIKNGEQK